MNNSLRMPFAEWLYRMHEAGLAYQARALAVYVAAFKISNNDELATLIGMADKTYLTHKGALLKGGWVIIKRRTGGRGIGIEVTPAFKETPVTFTDVSPRNPGRYYPGNEEVDTKVIPAPLVKNTPVKITEEAGNTPVIPAPLSLARNDSARGDSINNNNNLQLNNYPLAQEAASAREGEITGLVTVNGAAIYGPNFTLDFAAIDMASSLAGQPKEVGRQIAEICARDWAANQLKPQAPMAMIRKALASHRNDGQIQEIKVGKAAAATESKRDKRRAYAEMRAQEIQDKKARGYRPS